MCLCLLSGCYLPKGCPDSTPEIQFSPDGSVVAYVWLDNLVNHLGWPVIAGNTAYVKWCNAEAPERQMSVRIERIIIDRNHDNLDGAVHIAFSPDGKHLAVASPQRLVMIDLSDGKTWDLARSGEEVSSLCWLGNDELGYAAHINRDRNTGYGKRVLCRQKIAQGPDQRKVFYEDEGVLGVISNNVKWQLERWSPNGENAVLVPKESIGIPSLVNSLTGAVKPVGDRPGSTLSVSWSRDSTKLFFCADRKATLMDIRTNQSEDFSKEYVSAWKQPWPMFLPPLWMPEGDRLATAKSEQDGQIIRLHPFQAIKIGPILAKHDVSDSQYATIQRTPTPGIVVARTLLREYLVNYTRERVMPLNNPWFALSSDGKKIVELSDTGKVTVRAFEPP